MDRPVLCAETPNSRLVDSNPFALRRDALSDVLELIKVCGNTVFCCAASAPFGFGFERGRHRLHIIRSGAVSITVEGCDNAFFAEQGDLVMLMHGHGHIISDRPGRSAASPPEMPERQFDLSKLQLGAVKHAGFAASSGSTARLRNDSLPFFRQ